MRNRLIGYIAVSLLAIAILSPVLAQTAQPLNDGPGRGRGGAGRDNATPPPGPPHDPHDLSGIWLQFGPGFGGSARGRPRLGSEWTTGELPLTPAGLAKLNGNHSAKGPRSDVPAKGND